MSDVVIKVENLSKQYRLGNVGMGTLHHDINRWWHAVRGKEDPYSKIGDVNDRTVEGGSEYVWALRDINFEINKGEVWGIIGRNGAGKSTLLKILSRTTLPTIGSVKIKGRIASLLEVGTGFHPELTGRENIFLNGAILGMQKKEIKKKFDEIVDFAGVARYIDTPVKRYSSGMYVRLAFAVAAHLEPEILIVDEVLAVGDAEFQKKALGKMQNVTSGGGRTVLFVSHNMAAIKSLCNKCLYLKNGHIQLMDKVDKTINAYFLDDSKQIIHNSDFEPVTENTETYFTSWTLIGGEGDSSIYSRQNCNLKLSFVSKIKIKKAEVGLVLRDNRGELIFSCNSRDNGGSYFNMEQGEYEFSFVFRFPAKMGYYEIDVAVASETKIICHMQSFRKLQVLSEFDSVLPENWLGIISEPLTFEYKKQ